MKKTTIAIACALGLWLTDAWADVIDLSIGDRYYVGTWEPGHPADATRELSYLSYLIDLQPLADWTGVQPDGQNYNRLQSTIPIANLPTPTAGTAGSGLLASAVDPAVGVSVTGFTYVLGKYDASRAGALVWQVSGIAAGDTVSLPAKYNNKDLSHYTTFDGMSVPDGGMTLILLGGALVGLGLLRRTFSA